MASCARDLLWRSLAIGGVLDALRPPLLALQDLLGKDMTVWGVKWDGARLFWEIYVYDPDKEDPNATLSGIAKALEPSIRVLPRPRESIAYQMVSFDLDASVAERGDRRRGQPLPYRRDRPRRPLVQGAHGWLRAREHLPVPRRETGD